jgi:hypothetical protein
MSIHGYIPTERPRCEALWDSARELVEKECRQIPDTPKNDEKIGGLGLYSDPGMVACIAAIRLEILSRGGEVKDYGPVSRLAKILEKTYSAFSDNDLRRNILSKLALHHAFSLYSGLEPFKIDQDTKTKELSDYITEKTGWIIQELKNAKKLPASRLKGLVSFCVGLSQGTQKQEVPVYGSWR